MPQVTALTIDIGQTPDLQGGSQGAAESYQEPDGEFSRLVEQHIIGENNGKKKPEKDITNGKDGNVVENSNKELTDKAATENEGIKASSDVQSGSDEVSADNEVDNNSIAVKYSENEVKADQAKSKTVELLALLEASEKTLSANNNADKKAESSADTDLTIKDSTDEEQQLKNNNELLTELGAKGLAKSEVVTEDNTVIDKNVAINKVKDESVVANSNNQRKASNNIDESTVSGKDIDKVTPMISQSNEEAEKSLLDAELQKQAHSGLKQQNEHVQSDVSKQGQFASEDIKTQQNEITKNNAVISDVASEAKNTVINGADKQAIQIEQHSIQSKVDQVAAQVAASMTNNKESSQQSAAKGRVVNQSTAGLVSDISVTQDAKEQGKAVDVENKELSAKQLDTSEEFKNTVRDVQLESKVNLASDNAIEKPVNPVAPSAASSTTSAVQQQLIMDAAIQNNAADPIKLQKELTPLQTETIAIYRKDFSNAVKEKVMIMINQKLQQVDIQLDPPELGNVSVRVNLQGEQAAVNFVVQNQQAKEALDQNLTKLREMLAENGVDVGDANVEQQQQGNNENLAGDEQSSSSQQERFAQNEIKNSSINPNLFKASATGVDYYA